MREKVLFRKLCSAGTRDTSSRPRDRWTHRSGRRRCLVRMMRWCASSSVDFDRAIDRVLLGMEGPEVANVDAARQLVAYHEAGHAVAALLADLDDEVSNSPLVNRAGD